MTAISKYHVELAELVKTQSDRLLNEATGIAEVNFPDEEEVVQRQVCIDYLVLHAFLWYNIADGDERGEMICNLLDAFETTIV